MARTITVKGIGKASVRPDCIQIDISLNSKRKGYQEALKRAEEKIGAVRQAVKNAGFEDDALKTTDFSVQIAKNSVKDRYGNWTEVFEGFRCSHSLRLEFDFDNKKLGQILTELSKCDGRPDFNIRFTVKNPAEVTDELLINATNNARKKAEILCAASNVKLGNLITIDYNWSDVNLYSITHYDITDTFEEADYSVGSLGEDITPDDIKASDSATFVWEIE